MRISATQDKLMNRRIRNKQTLFAERNFLNSMCIFVTDHFLEVLMAIPFARLEFIKRSSGRNACQLSAYVSRSPIEFQGGDFSAREIFNFSDKRVPAYQQILLPDHVDPSFKSAEVLWNAVESKENRKNSVVQQHLVLALPDDKVISLDDKIFLTKSFAQDHFVEKGLGVQIAIHAPEEEKKTKHTLDELEKSNHNWHAHILITTRRFKANGKEFEDHKARDLMPIMRNGKVVSGDHWGKLWAHHQNAFFEHKGLSLRVDTDGVVPQKHLGPVRMRGRAFSLFYENSLLISLNALESEDPKKVLHKISQTKNIFTSEDVDTFIHKHVNPEKVFEVKDAFWKQAEIVRLLEPNTYKPLRQFTTTHIIEEEKQTFRLADRLFKQGAFSINLKKVEKFSAQLNGEQRDAFHHILSGQKLSCIEGHAGTGKSYLLAALKNAYESEKYLVRGFGPDSATAEVLKEKGFFEAENVYRFLFDVHNEKREIKKNREVWIIDESGKLGTRPLLELLKYANRYGAQLILSGNSAQLHSVERGMGFKVFSERYHAQHLENIQRQKDNEQRAIAKKLAIGEMGEALDAISRMGNIKWLPSKEEAMENLINSWALNRSISPNESTLIIAHSNREVGALNELVRLYRKEAGELPGKEYACETAYGKIYVSCGDRIEFRKNDAKLGVINGTEGVLIDASETSFTVQIKEKNKTRNITFDPQEYRKFQLGYATTTFHRSQGDAADRVYVLHSPRMNKEMFYVGFTRHFKKAEFFVSEQDMKYLSDLKRQAYKQTFKASTLEYLSLDCLENHHAQSLKEQKIQNLKSSDSALSKIKGMGLSAWEGVRKSTSKMIERYHDQKPDQDFFNPKFEKDKGSGKVKEVLNTQYLKEDRELNTEKIRVDFQKIRNEPEPKNRFLKPKSKTIEKWNTLPGEKQDLLREYFKSVDKAFSFYTIVKAEEELLEKKSPNFQEWQKVCGERNACAYEVVRSLKNKELRSVFEAKGLEILQERATKHDVQLQRKENAHVDFDAKLKEQIEPLLHRLFPEGPSKRDRRGLRFGVKGSLAVTCVGEKSGSFFDFEQQKGGGPLQLIQRSLSCSYAEAVTWAKDFIGQAPHIQIPSQFVIKNPEKDQEWVSLKPDLQNKAPSLKEVAKSLTANYSEAARYAYRDLDGTPLFYMLRLENESGKKIILPLSYGYLKGNAEEPLWSLKGYQAEKKPLYNLHLLREFPKSKVLIVEGEKTAEAASKMFPKEKMICLTWSGGAGAVIRSDWRELFMREVIIWPDNDKAGYEASSKVCQELRKIGIKSLHEVNRETLINELPPKWDLADPLPQDKSEIFIKNALLRAHEKAVGLDVLISHLKARLHSFDINTAHTVLYNVEERMRSSLEEKHGQKSMEIRSALLDETVKILEDKRQLKEILGTNIKGRLENLHEVENLAIEMPKHRQLER